MGRAPCCDKANVKRGPWSPEEDEMLKSYIEQHGTGGNWISLPSKAGLRRCGKSCRLRWLNYLRPDIKHGKFTEEEDRVIFSLYNEIGSRWSIIAAKLHGRTDNDVKNHWNTKLKKLVMMEDENNAFSKILSNPPAAAAAHSSSVTSDHESYSFVKFPNLKNETHQESLPKMPNLLPSFSGYGSSSSFVHNGFMVPTGLSKPPFSADSNLSSTISIAGNLSWADGAGNCVEDSGFLMDILNYGVEGMNHGYHLFQASVESGDQKFSGTEELGTATSSAMLSDYMMYEFKAQGLIDQY